MNNRDILNSIDRNIAQIGLDLREQYKDKIDFYISATFKDFVYILIFSVVFSIIIIFFRKNKITIT